MAYVLAIFWLVYLWRMGPSDPSSRTRRLTLALLAATSLAMFVDFAFPLAPYLEIFPIDDSYISLTAQRNFAERNLFAINPAAPLAGITSPLHVAVVGLLAKAIPLAAASRLVGLMAGLAVCFGVFAWAQLLGAPFRLALGAALLAALGGEVTGDSLNGLETALFSALVIWCFAAAELARARPCWYYGLGMLAGLSILTRPEGWFVAAAVFAVAVVTNLRRGRPLPRVIAGGVIALAVVSPYLLANYHFSGEFFPSTVSAKKYFFSEMCRPWGDRFEVLGKALLTLFGAFGVAAPLLLFARPFWRRVYPWLFMLLFFVAYLTQFPGALLHYGGRYNHPLQPALLVGLVLGAAAAVRWAGRFPGRTPRYLALGLALLLAGVAAMEGSLHHLNYRHRLASAKNGLLTVVNWIKSHTAPGDLVATHDIGALYYFGERPVLDLVGLTDPEVARFHSELTAPCADRAVRKIGFYLLLEERRPKLISMFRGWDRAYLGLIDHDRRRHLREVGHQGIKHTTTVYYFYECDWDRDLTAAP